MRSCSRMMQTWIRSFTTVALLLLLFSGKLCWGQLQPAPAQFSLTLGVGYDQGDFGSSQTSRAVYSPVSIRYSATKFDNR